MALSFLLNMVFLKHEHKEILPAVEIYVNTDYAMPSAG
jgi:hypothetical protein